MFHLRLTVKYKNKYFEKRFFYIKLDVKEAF